MGSWYTSILLEGNWHEKIYIYSFLLTLLCAIIHLMFLSPYREISKMIEREYRELSSKHLFLSFRKRKRNEVYARAKSKVSIQDRYSFYQVANISMHVGYISFGIGFWFFIGGFFYETLIHEPESYIEYEEENDYDDGYVEEDSNIHHIDSHWVEGYEKSDGTQVDGYWRGGEDGYYRSDPDEDLSNNLDENSGSYSENDGYDGYDGIGTEIGEFFFDN